MSKLDEPLSKEEAQKLRAYYQSTFDGICLRVDSNTSKYPQLKKLLNTKWRNQVGAWIASIQPGHPAPPTQLHHLIDALDPRSQPPFRIGIDTLEDRMQVVDAEVTRQGKTKKYKSTPRQLVVNNANQVHSALFEIAVLFALIKTDPNLTLFPQVGSGDQDVEAMISPQGRDIYCECAARGFSELVDNMQGAVNPYAAPIKMVGATLRKKLGPAGQLTQVAATDPTVLFTCVGFDSFRYHYIEEIEDQIKTTPCSAIIIFERYHCASFEIVLNEAGPNPLQEAEIAIIEAGLVQHLNTHRRARI